jgi:hypothetical protein
MTKVSILTLSELRQYIINNVNEGNRLDLVDASRLCGSKVKPVRRALRDESSLLYGHLNSYVGDPVRFISEGVPLHRLYLFVDFFANYDKYPRRAARHLLSIEGAFEWLEQFKNDV